MIDVLLFIVHGLLGAGIYCLLWKIAEKHEILRRLVLGAVAGYIYCQLHSRFSFPNAFVSIIVGYWATDFLEALFNAYKAYLERLLRKG